MVRWLTANLTVSLPEDEHDRIKKHPEIKWGAVARKFLIQYLNELEKSQELLEKSKQMPKDEGNQKQ
jgi:hypothetical protein